MTNETRNRIEAYKNALPEMKERVMAGAFLLIMSVMMLTSASFAWLTISRRPEVTGVNTSVAANGNLEIALAESTTPPGESQVGDSSATENQLITNSNKTWGNLVNLSDESYGLDKITLKPAQLNRSDLLRSPLFGAYYQEDGRVDKLDSNFAYTTWDDDTESFLVSDDLGIRAISSTKPEKVESGSTAQLVYEKRTKTEEANTSSAGAAYTAITSNQKWMNSLAVVMGTYMTAKLNVGQGDDNLTNPTMQQEDVKNLTELFGAFVNVYELQFEAMTELANYQLFLKYSAGGKNPTPYTEKTVDDIKGADEASLKKNEGLQISGLDQAIKDYPKLLDGYEQLQKLCNQGTVKWADSGLNAIVNSLMDVGKCTLDGTPINSIGAGNATQYLGKTCQAVITNGVLYNFEKMNGTRCDVKGLTVSAKVRRKGITIPGEITANITTNAPNRSQFAIDLEYADITYPAGVSIAQVAQDTYGLALDLWVRTNASGSYLMLEGNVLTESEEVRATGKDFNGNIVELYTLTRSSDEEGLDGENASYTLDLYKVVTKNNNNEEVTTWYNAASHTTVTLNDGEEPRAKMEELITVVGYEGENRVWEDANAWENNSMLSLDSTTQGSGSCYVYYADSPEDQARSLKLLEAMNVAFVDDSGTLLATAVMDTERYYAENGRVTVPLVLKSDSLNIGTEVATGEDIYAIAPLVQNEPMRIMALVYLDGTKLSNKEVLAASDIQGQLNIQFGSSVTLSHAEDETLMSATRSVSASVDKNSFNYEDSLKSGEPMKTNVTVTIDGDKPTKVEAFFIRAISSTQGSKEEVMTFTSQGDGATWTSSYTFTAPGNYILRSVKLDGQTYDLKTCPTVTVEGFKIDSLTCTQATDRHISIMTAADSSTVDLKLKFASDDVKAMPKIVQGRFLRDSDGTAVNINFTYNSDTSFWTGQATFISSGEYTLEYLVLDDEYVHLDAGMIQTATVYLGMKTAVYTDSPIEIKYVPSELKDNEKNLYMKVKIMDNTGKIKEGLQDARLYYQMEGSSILENGMNAPLTWDAESGYYTCKFNSKIGVFKFSHVTVGSNTITFAEDSPIFRVISPEPPSYVGFSNNAYVYSATSNIKMNVRLSYSSTATVAAVIRNTKDNTVYEVQGTKGSDANNIQDWNFLIPTAANGKQDGNWQLDEVRIWNYYDADGNYIEAAVDDKGVLIPDGEREEPLVFTMDGNVTKAVNTLTVKVNLTDEYDAHLGNSATSESDVTIATATASFLDSQTVTVPTVSIVDFENKPVGITDASGNFNSLIKDVKFTYDYDGNSQTYGGYTSDASVAKTDVLTVNLTSADGKTFTQSGTSSVTYAGVYTPELSYTVNGMTYIKTASEMGTTAPTFAVWSKKPTVTISSVSANPATARYYLTATPSSLNVITGSYNSKIDDYNAVVYMYVAAQTGTLDQEQVAIKYPTVTLNLTGVPNNHAGAAMVFPSGNNTTSTFSFAAGKTSATGTIGAGVDGVFNEGLVGIGAKVDSWPIFYPAGKQTVQTITVSYGDADFTVSLSDAVTINNPLYPPHVNFNSTASGQTLPTTPSRIYGTPHADGTFTIVLPGSQTWTEDKSSTKNEDFVVQSGYPSSRNVYTQRSETSGCNTTTYYTPYIETTTVSKASSSTTTWTRTWTITGWKLGSTTYSPGETIEITGNPTISAVLSYVDGTKTTESSTTTRTVIAYTQNGNESTSKPSGTKVDSVEGSTTDVVN